MTGIGKRDQKTWDKIFGCRTPIAYRAVREERDLRAELPGYDEYMTNVRYRFIPHVW